MFEPDKRRSIFISLAILFSIVTANGAFGATTAEANFTARLAKLERLLESRGLVDLLDQVESLELEISKLRGQLEEQLYAIAQLRKTQRETYIDLDQRLQGTQQRSGDAVIISPRTGTELPLETFTPTGTDAVAGTPHSSLRIEMQPRDGTDSVKEVPAQPEAPISIPPAVVETPPPLADPETTIDNETSEEAYRDAFNLLKAGQYEESITAFSEFLQLYPISQYADNAQYWLGETNYVTREFQSAIMEYRKLIEVYPESKKRSHAMLKIGYSHHELGEVEKARAVLEDLRNEFSGTTAARLAEERMQRILAESP